MNEDSNRNTGTGPDNDKGNSTVTGNRWDVSVSTQYGAKAGADSAQEHGPGKGAPETEASRQGHSAGDPEANGAGFLPAGPAPEDPEAGNAGFPPVGIPGYPDRLIYPAWMNVLAIIGVFIASWYAAKLVGWLFSNGDGTNAGAVRFLTNLVWFGITIGFGWWITTKRGTVTKPFRFSLRKTNPTLILWGLILVIVTSMVVEPIIDMFPRENLDRLQAAVGTGGWAMLTTIIMVPVLEEILFRGIIQPELTNNYGRIKGVLLASAVFGIVHFIPQQVVNAFFVGIILGYIYIRSGSLTPAILIHAINNAVAYIMMQLFGSDFMLTKSMFGNEVWYWIIYSLCCLIFIFAGWKLLRELGRLDNKEEEEAV